ncbi:MAG: NAD(P)H-dependent glycerol-3-phosphate dehydrogenase [Syntrophomonadaceae bacterium]|nr:NAD(P)H-dependent glycerol-3-phosphate dehydrogenase [Syntrophomonadaceae bacterium]MDD3271619.1 NAD(P)H-dependent glycerol-3-phosphate dehydrogenase [Syntrophomonadaceae bacterium]MDD4562505.1 NAD(P)H-dependent glycerol-3-phosphate dehydrogenase [Syntrophomonadaceae bacterium]
MKKIAVLGAGSWGTAQALLLGKKTRKIALWGRVDDGIEVMRTERENKRFLPGVRLPENVEPTSDLKAAVEDTELIVLAVPTQAVREVLKMLVPHLKPGTFMVNTAKGLEMETAMRLSQVAADVLGAEIREHYAVLSGPSHAEEVARGMPTVVTVASYSREAAIFVQDTFMSPVFRVYTNPDVAGVELGGALKNIIALATGMCDGLGFGDNTRAALMTRGLTEITRMGVALGGDYRTFSGLSGMGDLVVTCMSKYSRNRRAGELLGRGYNLQEALAEIGMAVEGAHTVQVVNQIADQMGVDMPISKACYNILYEAKLARETVETLMKRRKKHELEEIAVNIKGW